MNILKTATLLFTGLFSLSVWASTISKITIEGLQHIKPETVLHEAHVNVGDSFSRMDSNKLIKALYATEFFDSVELYTEKQQLIIHVKERPFIRHLTISGNELVDKAKLNESISKSGLIEGHIYNPAKLDVISASLKQAYDGMGHYNAKVMTTVTPIKSGQVDIKLAIHEGQPARIKQIKIIGNTIYSDKVLFPLFTLQSTNLWTFTNRSDRYVKEKLDADLEALRSYYLDRGYLKFTLDSTAISISPDKKHIYITIVIHEGKPYVVSDMNINVKDNDIDVKTLEPLLVGQVGEQFSRKALFQIRTALTSKLSDQGYAFAEVELNPHIDEETHKVSVEFKINPGRLVTVRRINFLGNKITQTAVLRREMRQLEGERFNLTSVEESKRRLANLSYLKNIRFVLDPVPGDDGQVDLNFQVDEQNSAYFTAEASYSAFYGFLYNFGIIQNNFMGTGKTVRVSFNHSKSTSAYNLSYFNPYATINGSTHSMDFYRKTTDAGKLNLSSYSRDVTGVSDAYGFPLDQHTYFNIGYGFELSQLNTGTFVARQIQAFTDQYGKKFDQVKLNTGLHYNTFDKAIFPTKGTNHILALNVKLPIFERSLGYYVASYNYASFNPLGKYFVLKAKLNLAYGNGFGKTQSLPFYEHFYAGGIDSIGGYESNSLGPKDSFGYNYGGNVLTIAAVDMIFPSPLGDSVRTAGFFNVGNVFDDTFDSGELRYSAGLSLTWISPMGPLKFILAKPINPPHNSVTKSFDFTIGLGM